MKDKLSSNGRRGGVLLIAGALLGAFIAGPGNSIAQKVMGLDATTADKRYVKRGETLAAGKTDETPVAKFNTKTFTPHSAGEDQRSRRRLPLHQRHTRREGRRHHRWRRQAAVPARRQRHASDHQPGVL